MTDRITDEMIDAAARAAVVWRTENPMTDRQTYREWIHTGRKDEMRAALSAALPLMDRQALPPVERDRKARLTRKRRMPK